MTRCWIEEEKRNQISGCIRKAGFGQRSGRPTARTHNYWLRYIWHCCEDHWKGVGIVKRDGSWEMSAKSLRSRLQLRGVESFLGGRKGFRWATKRSALLIHSLSRCTENESSKHRLLSISVLFRLKLARMYTMRLEWITTNRCRYHSDGVKCPF